jgi:uncharacterized RDD family membrane protein YckC
MATSVAGGAAAQTSSSSSATEVTAIAGAAEAGQASREPAGREVVRIGGDYTLASGDEVRSVVVIGGTATIEGHVDEDVVVVLGQARLSSTATINGSLIVPAGSAVVASGASVHHDVVVIGGAFEAPPTFAPGGEQILIGARTIGGRFEGLVPWLSRGALWGRPIVPELGWVWIVVGLFFVMYLALHVAFERPVRLCTEKLVDKPLTAFLVGLLVLLLVGPVCLLLLLSIVGILAVPFLLCAVLVAGIVGKVGVIRRLGMSVTRQTLDSSRLRPLGVFAAGFLVLSLIYMIPLLGFATWALAGVCGLGAAAMAGLAAYRQENPARAVDLAPSEPRASWRATGRAPTSAADLPAHETLSAAALSDEAAVESLEPPAPPRSPGGAPELTMFPHAVFRDRLAAFGLDIILVVVVLHLLDLTKRDGEIFLLLLAYHIGFWTWKGTTVGGIICQLRIARVDGGPLRFVDALVRGLSSIFSLAVVGLGCLWILKDPERQSWHDRIAGTYVVKVPRHYPL